MKRKYFKRVMIAAALALGAAGCAGLAPAPMDEIASLPIVKVGAATPVGSYVLHYPAGSIVPVKLKVTGSVFSADVDAESRVQLKEDLYLYKYWASHDLKTWKNSHALLNVDFSGGLDVDGVHVKVVLDKNR